jgi:hypothetical protein
MYQIGIRGILMSTEFEYIMSISETLKAGKWIAIVKREIIEGETAKEVFEDAKRKYPNREPFIMKVPDNSVMLL